MRDNNLSDTQKTINQVLEIQRILFDNPPNDKQFNKMSFNYTIELFNILMIIDQDNGHYSDTLIQKKINNLYNKIFKNRRY
ncbi:MAG: hypothetical protein IJ094_07870 [Bacilli bacterium]|nr:hypothetical protein [Bacilli bacterium]